MTPHCLLESGNENADADRPAKQPDIKAIDHAPYPPTDKAYGIYYYIFVGGKVMEFSLNLFKLKPPAEPDAPPKFSPLGEMAMRVSSMIHLIRPLIRLMAFIIIFLWAERLWNLTWIKREKRNC
jgi:hypothetical protein